MLSHHFSKSSLVSINLILVCSLHMAVTYWNESVGQEMAKLCSDDGPGINSFKIFMAYKVRIAHRNT